MTEHNRLALYRAYAAAVASMADPKKNATNPAFKRDGKATGYADLGQVLECIEGPLKENGLLLIQTVECGSEFIGGAAAAPHLFTKLVHIDTDQWMSSSYPLRPGKDDPQGFAAAVTYARRISIKTMFGMVDVDDDGNTASKKPESAAVKKAKEIMGGEVVATAETFTAYETAISLCTKIEDLREMHRQITNSQLSAEDKTKALAACKKAADEVNAKKTKKESA